MGRLFAFTLLLSLVLRSMAEDPAQGVEVSEQTVQPSFSPSHDVGYATDHLIVKYKAARKSGLPVPPQLVRLSAGLSVAAAVKGYTKKPDVEYAVPDYYLRPDNTPSDPLFAAKQWGLQRIGAQAAWDSSTGSDSVTVCTVDSGIDYNHPDIAPNMHPNRGFNAITGSNDPIDDLKHGTHIAGIIGASTNNALLVAGVNWKVKLLACKFMDAAGYGLSSRAIACIDYCSSQGAKVITASFSGGGYNQAMVDAINRAGAAGALFVVSAGNFGDDNDATPSYPASYKLPNMLVVASSKKNDQLSSFSNYGKTTVHLAAPGEGIMSTVPGGGTENMSGTSMAGPFVAGAAALLQAAANNRLTVARLRQLLLDSVDKLPAFNGKMASGGRLNMDKALQAYLYSQRTVKPKSAFCKKNAAACTLVCSPAPYIKTPPTCEWVASQKKSAVATPQQAQQQQQQQPSRRMLRGSW